MCGIIGQFGGKVNKKQFIHARDLLTNRGPDDCGVYYDDKNGAALGHRRLSIIDLSSNGRQPMVSDDGRYVIIFNGEIFNFIELRKELKDYPFKTKTDTEILLAAFIKWGPQCLNKLNGQFAFAIYDIRTNELFCARDRLGIKPFYYAIRNGQFLFASEIKSLLALGISPQPNDKIIFEYLQHSFYDHSEDTFFSGIKRLMPGQFAIWKNGKLKTATYWDLANMRDREGQYDDLSYGEAVELFKTLMADAIRLRFRSDVPVGLNLSSGLDSMSMLFFATTIVGGNIHLFSSGLNDMRYDETRHLNELLSATQKSFLHQSNLTPEKAWLLKDKLLEIQDEPYGGLSTIHYLNLYDETRIPGVTVLLEGQGMDEILAGYAYYKNNNLIRNVSQDMTKEGAPEVLNSDFTKEFQSKITQFEKPFSSPLLNMQYRDIRYTKLPRVLRFNDHISLAYSKELRVPYLDHRLVEFCLFLPKQFKIDGNRHKVLLRDAMKGVVPTENKDKPKVFFGAFQTEWLRKYFKKEVYGLIDAPSFKGRPYWNHGKIKEKVDDFFTGKGDNSFFLWQWLNLEMWLRKYID